MVILVWPSTLLMLSMGMPLVRAIVAKVWRAVWKVSFSLSPHSCISCLSVVFIHSYDLIVNTLRETSFSTPESMYLKSMFLAISMSFIWKGVPVFFRREMIHISPFMLWIFSSLRFAMSMYDIPVRQLNM